MMIAMPRVSVLSGEKVAYRTTYRKAAEKELKKACESCKNYEVQLCRLQEETKDSQAVIVQLREEKESLLASSQDEKKELDANISQLNQVKEDLEQTANESFLKIEGLEKEMEGLKKEKEIFIESARQAEEKITQLEDEITSLRESMTQLDDELLLQSTEKESALEQMRDQESSWVNQRNEYVQQTEQLKANIERMTQEFGMEEEKLIGEKTNLVEQLKKECEERRTLVDNNEKVEAALQVDIANLQKKLETSEEVVEQTIKSKEEVEESLTKTQEEISQHLREISNLQQKTRYAEQKTSELKGDVDVLQVQLRSANEEKSALLERLLTTEEDHKKTKQKVVDSNRKLEQALGALQELGQENQNMQVNQALKSNRQWLKDDACEACKKCDKGFSFTVRKHHCRQCGNIFCSECSAFQAVVASHKKPVRVCESCSVELSSLRGSNVRRLSNSSDVSSISTR